MKQDIQRIMLAAAKPLFLIFILYILKITLDLHPRTTDKIERINL